MTNPNPTSVRQRLKNIADTSGRPFAEVLQWYAIERFLARFAMTPHRNTLLLKGAALLRAWEADPSRPTMDIDELPENVDENDDYVELPHKYDLDLGKQLVWDFVDRQIPGLKHKVKKIFSRRGAYPR